MPTAAPVAAGSDAHHPLLRRAHPVAQASLGSFAAAGPVALPRDEYGPFTVQEVEVRSALQPCHIPGDPWSLNPYVGCSHACVYCYVPDVAKLERARWGSYVIAKRNLPTVLARELQSWERKEVFLSSATDPYQPAEHEHRVTRRCLEVLARHDAPLLVLTRNPLVTRDIDLFRRFTRLKVGLSVPTMDDEARRLLEPHAPPIQGRLAALRRLADAGIATYANYAPAYPLTGGVTPMDVAAAFRDGGVREVNVWPWRYAAGVAPFLAARVRGTPLEALGAAVWSEASFRRTADEVRAALRKVGVGAPR